MTIAGHHLTIAVLAFVALVVFFVPLLKDSSQPWFPGGTIGGLIVQKLAG